MVVKLFLVYKTGLRLKKALATKTKLRYGYFTFLNR